MSRIEDILVAIPSTEPATFSEFLDALDGDAPAKGERDGWVQLFNWIRLGERSGLIEVDRSGDGRLINSLVLTEVGAARVRELQRSR